MQSINVDKVFKKYDLNVELVEPYVYKVFWELLIAGKQVYICIDTEHPDGREMRVNHCIPLTKESGTYILKTLEQ